MQVICCKDSFGTLAETLGSTYAYCTGKIGVGSNDLYRHSIVVDTKIISYFIKSHI